MASVTGAGAAGARGVGAACTITVLWITVLLTVVLATGGGAAAPYRLLFMMAAVARCQWEPNNPHLWELNFPHPFLKERKNGRVGSG